MSNEDSITREELAEALKEFGPIQITSDYHQAWFSVTNPEGVRDSLFRLALAKREPKYEVDALYEDAEGIWWKYIGTREWWCWEDTNRHDFDEPTRPLRKMVPEDVQS